MKSVCAQFLVRSIRGRTGTKILSSSLASLRYTEEQLLENSFCFFLVLFELEDMSKELMCEER